VLFTLESFWNLRRTHRHSGWDSIEVCHLPAFELTICKGMSLRLGACFFALQRAIGSDGAADSWPTVVFAVTGRVVRGNSCPLGTTWPVNLGCWFTCQSVQFWMNESNRKTVLYCRVACGQWCRRRDRRYRPSLNFNYKPAQWRAVTRRPPIRGGLGRCPSTVP
jgi:hypothetical protein